MTGPVSPHAGKSILEIIWEELDDVMDRLMDKGVPTFPSAARTPAESWRDQAEEWQLYGEERGRAQGVAYALAVLTNPYHIDVDAIRATALERWKERTHEH